MAEPSLDIDRVVREVLAQLGLAPQAGSDTVREPNTERSPAQSPSSGDNGQAPAQATPGQTGGELVVLSHVVTMTELEGRLDTVQRLVVPPQAVVTPSVRDELARKNVTLVHDQPAAVPSAHGVRLVMMVPGSKFDPAALTRALQNEGIQVQTHRTDCLVAATDELSGEFAKPGTLGLVVSTYPAIALCLANRHQGVRAVWGIDAARAAADAASVGTNLLVVDPNASGVFQMKQMIIQFCRAGPRECPELLRERLH